MPAFPTPVIPVEPKLPVSERKLAANRRNAMKSSGPRTPRGRAVSSQNARRFKLLPFEDPALPRRITAQYYGYFIPLDKLERRLVDSLIYADRLRRHYLAQEARAIAQQLRDLDVSSIEENVARNQRQSSSAPYRLHVAESAARNAFKQLDSSRRKAA